ncbi:hypothetical protein ACU4HD_31420 [Cupriavidus basilensis]
MTNYSVVEKELNDFSPYELARLIDADGVLSIHLVGSNDREIEVSFDGYLYYSKFDEGMPCTPSAR